MLTLAVLVAVSVVVELRQEPLGTCCHHCLTKGCFISECTINTYDRFHCAKQNKLPGIILLIDFEKAFDSVSFDFNNFGHF